MQPTVPPQTELRFITAGNMDRFPWQALRRGGQACYFLEPFLTQPTSRLVANASVEMEAFTVGDHVLPVAIASKPRDNRAYVASPTGQYIRFSREEILARPKYGAATKAIARPAFAALRALGALTGWERTAFVNDWLLSSNLWPKIDPGQVAEMIEPLTQRYPGHAIAFRSICEATEGPLMEALIQAGCLPVVSRRLYLLDTQRGDYRRKRPLQQDRKRWRAQDEYQAEMLQDADEADFNRLRSLYEAVYMQKYSRYNPHYTNAFIRRALESGWLNFQVLRHRASGRIDAVQAILSQDGMITTPFIGHDTSLPAQTGLYRYLNVLLTEEAERDGLIYNMSSGASDFKRQRGGRPAFEYNMVYLHHLPRRRQWAWRFWHWLSERYIKPGMEKHGV
jgi:hypothetical protein